MGELEAARYVLYMAGIVMVIVVTIDGLILWSKKRLLDRLDERFAELDRAMAEGLSIMRKIEGLTSETEGNTHIVACHYEVKETPDAKEI